PCKGVGVAPALALAGRLVTAPPSDEVSATDAVVSPRPVAVFGPARVCWGRVLFEQEASSAAPAMERVSCRRHTVRAAIAPPQRTKIGLVRYGGRYGPIPAFG